MKSVWIGAVIGLLMFAALLVAHSAKVFSCGITMTDGVLAAKHESDVSRSNTAGCTNQSE